MVSVYNKYLFFNHKELIIHNGTVFVMTAIRISITEFPFISI